MSVSVEVRGLETLRASLAAREKKLSGDMVKRAFKAGAETIAETARALAPRRTGYMATMIETKAARSKDLATAKVLIDKTVFQGFPYASVIEKGHFLGSRKNKGRKWVEGKHFFAQALLQHSTDVPEQVVSDIWEEISKDQL